MHVPVEQTNYIYGDLVVCNGDGIRPCLKSNQLKFFLRDYQN